MHDVLSAVAALAPRAVVVANDPILAAELAARRGGGEVVLWLHNFLVGEQGEALRRLPQSVRIVTVSDAVRVWTAESYELDPSRLTVIHNGVDLQRFHPPSERARSGPLRVVCHGRIDPNKGFLLAAEAVALLRRTGRADVELTVIGGRQTFGYDEGVVDDYMTRLETAVAEAGGTFTGRVAPDEVAESLRAFDVACVLPLVPDPFPLAGLEAMSSGCAMVVVPLGGVAEWGGDAVLAVTPDSDSVADALETLDRDRDLLARAQTAARSQAERFGWDAAVVRLLAVVDAPTPAGAT